MNSFVQNVFNEISLERNPKLWQSENDLEMPRRIKFLSEFEETLFSSQLFNEKNVSKGLRKNTVLCNAFKKKLETVLSDDDKEKKLTLLNQALCFSEVPEKESEGSEFCENTYVHLILDRISTLKSLKYFKEALEDVKVLEEYHDHSDTSDPGLSDYFTNLYKLKFSLELEKSLAVGVKLFDYNKQYEGLEESKDYIGIQNLIDSINQQGLKQTHLSKKSDEGKSCFLRNI
jgi:hypothetical protein